jgi:hypothetical protein
LPADDRLRSATFDFSKCLDWFLTKVAPNAGPSTFGSVWPSIALHLSSTHGAESGQIALQKSSCSGDGTRTFIHCAAADGENDVGDLSL